MIQTYQEYSAAHDPGFIADYKDNRELIKDISLFMDTST